MKVLAALIGHCCDAQVCSVANLLADWRNCTGGDGMVLLYQASQHRKRSLADHEFIQLGDPRDQAE